MVSNAIITNEEKARIIFFAFVAQQLRKKYNTSMHQQQTKNFDSFIQRAREISASGHPEQALQILRAIRTHSLDDIQLQQELRTLIAQTKVPATLTDIGVAELPDHAYISAFLACFPKSGSTFVSHTLSKILQRAHDHAFFSAFQSEQDIYLPRLVELAYKQGVIQQHVRATEANIQYLQALNIKPIVLVRNIFDALDSMRNMTIKTGTMDYLQGAFKDLPQEIQSDITVQKWSFWYVDFYVSWRRAQQNKRLDIMFVRYEDITEKPEDIFPKILQHINPNGYSPMSKESILEIVNSLRKNPDKIRLRKGKKRDGYSVTSQWNRDFIKKHTEFFPKIDFSSIGL